MTKFHKDTKGMSLKEKLEYIISLGRERAIELYGDEELPPIIDGSTIKKAPSNPFNIKRIEANYKRWNRGNNDQD